MSRNKNLEKKYQNNKKWSKNSNYKKSYNKQKPDVKDSEVSGNAQIMKSGPVNDPGYYVGDANLTNQSYNFSFRNIMGLPSYVGDDVPLGFPSIAIYKLRPTLPFTTEEGDPNDGLNMAAFKMWLDFTYMNKREITYGPQDITTLILAFGSILALASDITRTFGLATVFNARNRQWPQDILKVLGVSDDDLANLADLRTEFNYLITNFNKLPFPTGLPYLDKCSKLFSGIYLDEGGSAMAQAYVFTWDSLWKFNDTYSEEGTGLNTVYNNNKTLAQKIQLFNELVAAITGSTALGIIQGDIMRYMESKNIAPMFLATVPVDYVVLPAPDDEMSLWLDNAIIVPNGYAASPETGLTPYNDVVPSVNKKCVVYRPQLITASGDDQTIFGANVMVNFWHENPTVAEKIIATRLMNPIQLKATTISGTTKYIPDRCAFCDWALVGSSIYTPYVAWESDMGFTEITRTVNMPQLIDLAEIGMATDSAKRIAAAMGMMTQFNHHPRCYIKRGNLSSNARFYSSIGDVQYWTTLKFDDVEFLQDIAMQGLFTFPK